MNLSFLLDEGESAQHDVFQQLLLQREWHYYRIPLKRDAFSELYAALWAEVSYALGPNITELLTTPLITFLHREKSRGARCVIAEVLAGLTRSVPLLTSEPIPLTTLAQLWTTLFSSLTPEDDRDVTYAIRYAAYHRHPRRLHFLYRKNSSATLFSVGCLFFFLPLLHIHHLFKENMRDKKHVYHKYS